MQADHKRCVACGEDKPLAEYHRRASHKDGLSYYCKPCQKVVSAAQYIRHRDKRVARNKEWATENRDLCRSASNRHYARLRQALIDHKLAQGCLDCGYRASADALEFDHRPGELKSFTLGNDASLRKSKATIWAEVARCDVVCANCHAIRTANRRRERAEDREAS